MRRTSSALLLAALILIILPSTALATSLGSSRKIHVIGAPCASCHTVEAADWASPADLHALPAADVLLNSDHNTNEQLVDECLNCHSMFQRPMGIAAFVTPIDQVGPWTLVQPAATTSWQATRCEVCHDPTTTRKARLSKYGAILDGPFSPSYTPPSALPRPSQSVFDPTTDSYVDAPYTNSSLRIDATKICDSCHDPADQGGDPNVVVGGHDYGPQGGDSRSFVTASHEGLTCIDCHPTHDFTPVDPEVTVSCKGSACHDGNKKDLPAGGPGVVHANHIQ